MLIGIEGPDGCGKSIQVEMLADALAAADPRTPVKTYAFPNRTTLSGGLIDQLLKGKMRVDALVNPAEYPQGWPDLPTDDTAVWRPNINATAMALQCAMIVNRMELVPGILEHCRRGDTVIFDRYTDSGIVYGTADGISSVWLARVQLPLPPLDLHILLDIDVETSFARRPHRQEQYEANRERMRQVCEGYRAWWCLNQTQAAEQRTVNRWVTLDGRRESSVVHQDILRATSLVAREAGGC